MKTCPQCDEKLLFMGTKRVCADCDELLFDIEIECDDLPSAKKLIRDKSKDKETETPPFH